MKKIEAIVPSSEMETTFDALEKMGINFSYCDIKGRGQTPRLEEEYDMGSGRVKVREEFKTNALIITVVNDSMEEKRLLKRSERTAKCAWKNLCVRIERCNRSQVRATRRVCATKIKTLAK